MIDSHVKLTISLQFSYRCDRQKVEPRFFKNSGAILRTIFPNKAVATDIFVLTDNSKIVLNYVASCQESPVFSATGSFWYQGFKPEPFIDIRSLAAGSPARDLCRNKTKQKKKKISLSMRKSNPCKWFWRANGHWIVTAAWICSTQWHAWCSWVNRSNILRQLNITPGGTPVLWPCWAIWRNKKKKRIFLFHFNLGSLVQYPWV